MKKSLGSLILLVSIALLATALAGSTDGQTAARTKPVAAAPKYDLAKEVTLEGNVTRVVTEPTAGMLAGAHLIVRTSSGTLDAHLGSYAMRGMQALTLIVGQHVKLVGVMTSALGQPVLLVRTLQSGSGFRVIRNPHGLLIQPGSAVSPSGAAAAKKDGD